MHSSRMRTGSSVTVSGGASQKKKLETPGTRPPPGPDHQPPPPVDRQTPVNLLPWPNFVAAGKYVKNVEYLQNEEPAKNYNLLLE